MLARQRILMAGLAILSVALATGPVYDAHAFMPLHMIALRITDLRPGYSTGVGMQPNGYQKPSFIAYEENVSTQQLTFHGWANGYHVRYEGPNTIENDIEQFNASTGAHWFYSVTTGNTLCCGASGYHTLAWSRVGSESVAYGGRGNGIIFRSGEYVVDVWVDGPSSNRGTVLGLARLELHRIQQSG